MSEQWRPSNGTDGDIWMYNWCALCSRDPYPDEAEDGGCPVFLELLLGYSEHVVREGSSGRCLKFREGPYEPPHVEVEGQRDLFVQGT